MNEVMRIKNPYSEYHTCKHCGQQIGHRPYTRGWEHVKNSPRCKDENAVPVTGMCFCSKCKSAERKIREVTKE